MRNRPHVAGPGWTVRRPTPAGRPVARPVGQLRVVRVALTALAASALVAGVAGGPAEAAAIGCAGAIGLFACSLPGAAPDGVLIGFGGALVSMIGWHHPA